MSDDEHGFWDEVPSPLDDPLGWMAGWWRRAGSLLELIEFVLFVALGILGIWRFFTRRLITEDLYVFVGFVVLGVAIGIQRVLKKARS